MQIKKTFESKKGFLRKLQKNLKFFSITIKFQMKKEEKKFIIFTLASSIFLILSQFLFYYLPSGDLPEISEQFFYRDITLYLLTVIGTTLFFAGIISEDYDKKTGLIIFPKIKRTIFFIGKFMGSYLYISLISCIIYGLNGIISYYFYADIPLSPFLTSFHLTVLYLFAFGGFVSLISALLRNETAVIVFSLLIGLLGFEILELLIGVIAPKLEPLFSLQYLHRIILIVYEMAYLEGIMEVRFCEDCAHPWYTPTISGAIFGMLAYFFITIIFTIYILKKKEL